MPDSAQVNVKTDPLLELAERCEAATEASDSNAGPIRALEIEIHDTLFGKDSYNCGGDGQRGIPRYLRSLDAAMSLVPEGLTILVDQQRDCWIVRLWSDNITPVAKGRGATEALARIAAALRARASMTSEGVPG